MSHLLVRLHPSSKWERDVTQYSVVWPDGVVQPEGYVDFGRVNMYKLEEKTPLNTWLRRFVPQDNWQKHGGTPADAEMPVGQDWYTDDMGLEITARGGVLFTVSAPHPFQGVIDLAFY